jgi:hypothetical protein
VTDQPEIIQELLDVKESLTRAIRVLQAILDDVNRGTYSTKQAELDVENLLMTEGLDFISTLQDYAEGLSV